jgi:intracellular sulfur oxidation DsrE/DsrF family protein
MIESIDTSEVEDILKRLANKTKQYEEIRITVWTNGKGIRKYTGQDKQREYKFIKPHSPENGWYKATAIIIKEEQ